MNAATRKGLTFAQFKVKVDERLSKKVGLISDGMPDYDYYSCWKSGMTIGSTVELAIQNAKDF